MRSRRILIGLGLSIVSVTNSCGSPGTPQVVSNGAWTCNEDDHASWQSYWPELTYDFDLSRGCPYVVDAAGSYLSFEMRFKVDVASNPQPWYDVSFAVWNNAGTKIRQGQVGGYNFVTADSYGRLRADIISNWPGGTGNGPNYRDSTYFLVSGGNHGPHFPWVRHRVDGTIRTVSPTVIGETYVVSDYPQSWQADVSGSGLSYRYQWFVDGTPVTGATGQGLVHTLTEGQHTIRAEIRLSDDVVYIRELAVTAVNCGGPNIC